MFIVNAILIVNNHQVEVDIIKVVNFI